MLLILARVWCSERNGNVSRRITIAVHKVSGGTNDQPDYRIRFTVDAAALKLSELVEEQSERLRRLLGALKYLSAWECSAKLTAALILNGEGGQENPAS